MNDNLANYATINTKGRLILESYPKYRTEFQRDRDRIIHSSSFRRLGYKTQVFINHEGDLFRTRLTHSLEVAQIGGSVARALKLNLYLVEAICLAHDLGHPPFGHLGQDILNQLLISRGFNGFEHNIQSLRIVDKLEERYAKFDGLNLTYETREGILKHCGLTLAKSLGNVGERFLLNKKSSLEAQLANVVDELAYNYHDVDDGLRAGLISLDNLESISLISCEVKNIKFNYPKLDGRRLHKELIRNLIDRTIYDLIENTLINIEKYKINSLDDAINAPINIVNYSEEMRQSQSELKKFLHKNLYKHTNINQLRYKASMVVKNLFEAYMSDYNLLPTNYISRIDKDGLHRVVADYISGMTDRYAFRQYNRLFTVENI
jgi:dGTPase